MHVALMLPPDCALPDVTAHARRAEEAGFDAIACGEHLFFHGPTANAFVALAAAAGATDRIRLLSALTILPLYPVALAAKLIATLDGVSGGRFDLGIGVGGEFPPEFDAAGVPVNERGRRTDEALHLLARLFTGAPVHADGRYSTFSGQELAPVPVQQPSPPIWVGGRRDASARRAGRYGTVWVPYLVTPRQLASGLAVARTAAAEDGRPSVQGAVYCWSVVGRDARQARRTATEVVGQIYQQDFGPLADRYLLTGTPAEVLARVREYHDAGADSLVFAPACPAGEWDEMLRLFTDDVLPGIHDV
jgi:alkanesulfonate monooxygenase SsuD/methylene tetrahydromethanopterin reductase-like flavin-dependent oxidoreductase (luciferase family)